MRQPDLTGLEVSKPVVFVDGTGKQHSALVTCVFGDPGKSVPCINIVLVDDDANRQDSYGRQIRRETSVVHRSSQAGHGYYYMMPGDIPNPIVQPTLK